MIQQEYPYQLAKRCKWICPNCGKKRFVCYVDSDGNVLDERVGKCDRANNCAYHYPPRQFFDDNKSVGFIVPRRYSQPTFKPTSRPKYIDKNVFKKSLQEYDNNNLIAYLKSVFGKYRAQDMRVGYNVGTSRHWNGATVFWQVDRFGNIHRGKIMLYNATNGKRVKEPFSHITSVHSVMKIECEQPPQCLFGEHLLPKYPNATVAIVESEKTALICTAAFQDCITLACGGCGNLTPTMCEALKGRHVVLFPDNGKFKEWGEKGRQLRNIFGRLEICDIMERNAVNDGDDIDDFIVQHYPNFKNVDLGLIEEL